VLSSQWDQVSESANELRQPSVFNDVNGQFYLFYATADKQNIGIAQLFAK